MSRIFLNSGTLIVNVCFNRLGWPVAQKFVKSENIAEGGERNAGVRGRELCNTKELRVQETYR
jgi:hypothetical protein